MFKNTPVNQENDRSTRQIFVQLLSGGNSRASSPGGLGRVLVFLALVGVVMLPRVLNLDVFVGPDEKILLGWGNDFALSLSRGDLGGTLIGDGYPAVTTMWINTLGVGLKWLGTNLAGTPMAFVDVIDLDRPFVVWPERRLFLAFFNGLQILAAYPLLWRIWNRPVAGLAVFILGIEPLFLAFTRMIRADAVLSGFMLLSMLSVLVYVKTGDRRYNWLAGAMGGLAALSKLTGGVMAVIAVLVYAAVAWRRGRRDGAIFDFSWWARSILSWGVPAALVFFGLWPAWWFFPVLTFNLLWGSVVWYAQEVTALRAGVYFWGAYRPQGAGFAFYWVLAALRLTPWLLLGSLVAVVRRVWLLVRRGPGAADGYSWAMILYVAVCWLMTGFISLKTDRYFLPIIPGLAVLAALEIVAGARWLLRRLPGRISKSPAFVAVSITIGVIVLGYVMAYHPLYSTYYDSLIATPQSLQRALPVGNGEGVDTALKHLSTIPGAIDSLVVCGTNFPRCQPFFDGEMLHQEELRSSDWFKADYALWHVDEQQTGVFPPGVLNYLRRQPEIFTASYHGVEYTWLYAVPQPAFLTGGSKLEGVATLYGYDVDGGALPDLSPGDNLTLHLYWRNEGQAALQDFWWRVVDEQGYVWSQAIAAPSPEFEADAGLDGAVVEGFVTITLPSDIPPGEYFLAAGFADEAGDVGRFDLPWEGSALAVAGPTFGPVSPAHSLDAALAPDLYLKGYSVSLVDGSRGDEDSLVPGENAWVSLYWQTTGKLKHDYSVNLFLVDTIGQRVVEWSGIPVSNTYPTSQWKSGAHLRDPWRVSLPSNLQPGGYRLGLALFGTGDVAQLAEIGLGNVDVVHRRVEYEVPPVQYPAELAFGDVATLRGYDLLGDLMPDGARLLVTFYWQALSPTKAPYSVQVRLVDGGGNILAEQTSPPARGTISTTDWQAGEIVADEHVLELETTEPASFRMELRLVDDLGGNLPLLDGSQELVITDVDQKTMWRMPAQ